MDPKLFAQYETLVIERSRWPKKAERGWLIEQAVASRQGPIESSPARRQIGRLIVAIGQRVQGMPEVARPVTDPGHAH